MLRRAHSNQLNCKLRLAPSSVDGARIFVSAQRRQCPRPLMCSHSSHTKKVGRQSGRETETHGHNVYATGPREERKRKKNIGRW